MNSEALLYHTVHTYFTCWPLCIIFYSSKYYQNIIRGNKEPADKKALKPATWFVQRCWGSAVSLFCVYSINTAVQGKAAVTAHFFYSGSPAGLFCSHCRLMGGGTDAVVKATCFENLRALVQKMTLALKFQRNKVFFPAHAYRFNISVTEK